MNINDFSGVANIFTSVGVVLTFIISIAQFIYTVRKNKKKDYINVVLNNKIILVDTIRKVISEYSAQTTISRATLKDLSKERYQRCVELNNRLKILLYGSESMLISENIMKICDELLEIVTDCYVNGIKEDPNLEKRSRQLVAELIKYAKDYLESENNNIESIIKK